MHLPRNKQNRVEFVDIYDTDTVLKVLPAAAREIILQMRAEVRSGKVEVPRYVLKEEFDEHKRYSAMKRIAADTVDQTLKTEAANQAALEAEEEAARQAALKSTDEAQARAAAAEKRLAELEAEASERIAAAEKRAKDAESAANSAKVSLEVVQEKLDIRTQEAEALRKSSEAETPTKPKTRRAKTASKEPPGDEEE